MPAQNRSSAHVVDAAVKAQFAVRLMHIARDLARCGADDRQGKILARYVLMHADTAQRYLSRWKQEHERSAVTLPVAQAAKTPLKRFRQEYTRQKETRDRLVARRISMARGRAADLRNTAMLWRGITARSVDDLCWRALRGSEALGATRGLDAELSPDVLDQALHALRGACLDSGTVYIDATSYASGESNLLPVTPGGAAGAVIMRVNDHHSHLETLFTLHDLAQLEVDAGLLLRQAVVVETNGLIEAVIGSLAHSRRERTRPSLIDAVDRDRGEWAYDELQRLRDEVIPEQTRINLRDMRDQIAAHFDEGLSLEEIKNALLAVSVGDLFLVADRVLDWLDAVAIGHVDLGTLVIGHRAMKTLVPAVGPSLPAQFQPPEHAQFVESPFLVMAGGGFGPAPSAALAGAVAGRRNNRRQRWFPIESADESGEG